MLLGLKLAAWMKRSQAAAIKVTGVVTGSETFKVRGENHHTYAPTVQFQTPAGEQVVVKTKLATTTMRQVGESIEISYPPGKPHQAMLHVEGSSFGGIFVFLLGALFAGIGVIAYFAA